MRNLELESYGVVEMDQGEMHLTDGGDFWKDLGKTVAMIGLGAAILLFGITIIMVLLNSGGSGGDGIDASSIPHNL